MTTSNVPVLLPSNEHAVDTRATQLLAISHRIRQVEQIAQRSQYPSGQVEAIHYLRVAETYRSHACTAIANGRENAASELIFLCEEELSHAAAAAARTKQEQQEFVDKIYPRDENGQLKSCYQRRTVFL